MRLSKSAYYADFLIYAMLLLVVIGICAARARADWIGAVRWLSASAAGFTMWTLLEYLLHRFVLHEVAVFAAMHAVHHEAPRAFVGTPTWLTLSLLWLVFFVPAWWLASIAVASAVIAGVMWGFLWYGVMHHVIHHGRPRALAAVLRTAARRHRLHHHAGRPGNFGVTIAIWDHLFGTSI